MEPTKKIKSGLLAVALGFSTAFAFAGGISSFAYAQTSPASVTAGIQSNSIVPSTASDSLNRSQELLLKARHSLMNRDVASAERFVQEADVLNAPYANIHDRPAYVNQLIQNYKKVDQLVKQASAGQASNETARAEMAKFYLQQAEGLRRCRDLDNAEILVREAGKLNVTFDTNTVSQGMDLNSVSTRISDDRMLLRQSANGNAAMQNLTISEGTRRQVADIRQNLSVARQMLAAGKVADAEKLALAMNQVGLPENVFADGDSPSQVLTEIARYRSSNGSAAVNAGNSNAFQGNVRQVQNDVIIPSPDGIAVPSLEVAQSNGLLYVQEGEAALRNGNADAALTNFKDALKYQIELDKETLDYVQGQIASLEAAALPKTETAASGLDFSLPPTELFPVIQNKIIESNKMRETKPGEALEMLETMRKDVTDSTLLDDTVRNQYLLALDQAIADTDNFITVNGPMINLDAKNQAILQDNIKRREQTLQLQAQLQDNVEKFNQLLDEGKYDQAEILAKKTRDLDPTNPLGMQLVAMAGSQKQAAFNSWLRENKEAGVLTQFNNVESAMVYNVSDENPMVYDNARWTQFALKRQAQTDSSMSESDREIRRKLDTIIQFPYDTPMPLSTVTDYLRNTLEIPIVIDMPALEQLGLTSEIQVPTGLSNITLKSFLKHTLEPHGLTYVVGDEVLKITSVSQGRGKIVTKTYYVGDLVIPIPNFTNTYHNLGMTAQYQNAFNIAAQRGRGTSTGGTINGFNSTAQNSNVMFDPATLGQVAPTSTGAPIGDGGQGGQADWDQLIDLITQSVDPESWDEVGDPMPFDLNLSLSIRQTEENHEEIRDLLAKLRSLNDLQICIEVRFITLNDEYYEKMGVNFTFNWKSNAPSNGDDGNKTPAGAGIFGTSDASGTFTDDLSVGFSQGSYGLTTPQFGNYDATAGAQLGFAILSNIESYFFVSAAQGDRRTNVLQAPKVTMFNGQTAQVSDTSSSPFVMGVIPVVGDFAVAQQPVVVIINEGQFLTVKANATNDRRYVRMTVVPFFSKITDKDRTFKFEGSEETITDDSSTNKGTADDPSPSDEKSSSKKATTSSTGTTIQLPTYSSVQVSTTVNVPDGGTVLLGGIKRLSEGRTEAGVPLLSKIPYLKRLFSNSAVGRETQSLMMMVTPRIIIQEEEEQYVTGGTSGSALD